MPLLLLTSLLPPLSLTASLPRSPSPCQHFLLTRGVADLKVRLRRLFFDLLVCSFLSFTCSNSGLKKKSGFGLNEAATETLWPFFVLQKKKTTQHNSDATPGSLRVAGGVWGWRCSHCHTHHTPSLSSPLSLLCYKVVYSSTEPVVAFQLTGGTF